MRSANKGARSDDWEPALGMAGDGQDVTVRVAEGVDGSRSAVLLPASARRLNGEQTEVLSQMQHRAIAAGRIRRELDDLAVEARDVGISWSLIGWSVGLTGEAARQRWGDLDE